MSRPYSMRKHHGFLFHGNNIHPDELSSINAQLAHGRFFTDRVIKAGDDVEAHMLSPRPHERHNREFSSTILDRLQGRLEILEGLAKVAMHNVLPDRWSMHEQDGVDELVRDRRLDLLQELGEMAVEAPAA